MNFLLWDCALMNCWQFAKLDINNKSIILFHQQICFSFHFNNYPVTFKSDFTKKNLRNVKLYILRIHQISTSASLSIPLGPSSLMICFSTSFSSSVNSGGGSLLLFVILRSEAVVVDTGGEIF